MNDQDWSPVADEPRSAPRPAPSPGRASVPVPGTSPAQRTRTPQQPPPSPYGSASPPPPEPSDTSPPHDRTTPLRPPAAARAERGERPDLIPAPDATAILPQIPDTADPAPAGADRPERKKRGVKRHRGAAAGARKAVRGAGEVLITFGVVVLLYALYEVYGVSGEINSHQDDLSSDLDIIWEAEEDEGVDGAPVPDMGDAFARMWAPDIREESWTLVEGTDMSDIEYAPGRYEEGAYPGEQGNFTLAGHNVPAIFQKIRDLEPGDKVVIETKENFYIYEVGEHVVVDETQVDITAPVPGEPGAEPGDDDYWLTLFTCHPLWDNYERYVVYSTLVETVERDPNGDLPDAAIDPEA